MALNYTCVVLLLYVAFLLAEGKHVTLDKFKSQNGNLFFKVRFVVD